MSEEFSNVDVNSANRDGETKLHLAASGNDLSLVKQLLSQGAYVNARDVCSRTPLLEAAERNKDESHFDVIETLLKHGADPNAPDNLGRTPFNFLAEKSNLKTVQLFLSFKADVSTEDYSGQTPLFSAATNNKNAEVVQLLLDLGLNVNHRCDTAKTPLLWACGYRAYENLEIIKCLLKHGANMNAPDYEGLTPSLWSVTFEIKKIHREMFEKSLNFIMEHADFNVIHKGVNILNVYYSPFSEWKRCLILKHLAKLKALDTPVHPDIFNIISGVSKYKKYFNPYVEELLRAKSTTVPNSWITFFNLLTDNRRKLKNYAGNRELVKSLEKTDILEKFPAYGTMMVENMEKGIRRRKLFDCSAVVLSDCMPIFNPTHLIVRDVLDCIMSKKDLLKFCEEA